MVEELEIVFVLLTKGYSGCAPPDGIDVELDRSVAEHDAFEYRMAAVQPHQAVIKTELAEELSVLLGLPAVSGHGDRDRFRGLGNRKCWRLRVGSWRRPESGSHGHVREVTSVSRVIRNRCLPNDLVRRCPVSVPLAAAGVASLNI